MASTIRIKRSTVVGNPSTLAAGELAYSALTDGGVNNGGDRLYIGMGSETGGNAANHFVIGGKYFTDMLDQTPGVLTTSSAIVVDSNKKIDQLLVDNLDLNGNTITTLDTNGNLILTANGSGKISFYSAYTFPRTDGTVGYALVTDGAGNLSWSGVSTSNTSTNLAGGATGSIPYQTGPGATAFIPIGSSTNILQSNGTTATWVSTGTLVVSGASTAGTANSWATARTLTLAGDLSGSVSIDGSSGVTLTATIAANSVALGTDTTGDYVSNGATSGFGLSGSTTGETQTFTVTSNATSTNATNTLVFRNAAGDFAAGTITASLTGNATSADKWSTARTITLAGDLSGSVSIDGSAGVTLTATVVTDSIALGTDTTGLYVATAGVSGFGLSGTANTEGSAFTVTSNATSTNATNTLVFRDGAGNFNAGTITATTFSGTLGTGGAQTISTNALTLSGYADNGGILFFTNGAGTVASQSSNFRWNNTNKSLEVLSTASASSTQTGALIISGGAGIGQDLFVGGGLDILSTQASTSTVANNALYVAGGVGIGSSLYVTGPTVFQNDVVFSGTTTYVFSTQTVYTDNILNLHAPSGGVSGAWTVNDGKDVGFVFHNYIDGADNDSFLGFANDTKYLEWYVKGAESTASTFTGTVYGTFKTGGIVLTNTTASSSTATGALTVAGGVGIGGNLYVGGTLFATVSGAITTASNLAGGTAGQIPYQTGAGATSFAGPGTAGQLLVSNGTSGPVYTNTGSITVGAADRLTASRTITLAGDLSGSVGFDGTSGVTLTATIAANSVALGTDTTGDYVSNGATSGFGLSGSTTGETQTFTVASNATSTNVSSTLVYRDTSGNFSAANITAALTGNATSADKWSTARTITLAGDLSGSVSIDGSAGVTLTATVAANSVALGTDTTGDYVSNGATSGFGISGSTTGETQTFTVTSNATSTNATNTIVFRDASGNFSAGTITASLTGTATTATNLAAGSANQIPYQTGAGATSFLAAGSYGQVLQVINTATGAFAWGDIDGGTY